MFDDKRSQELLEEIVRELRVNNVLLYKIKEIVNQPKVMAIKFRQGDIMSAAAVALNVGQTVQAIPVENNADGSVFVFNPANIVWSAQNPAIASVAAANNPDGSTVVTAVGPGVAQIGVADTVTGLSAVATVTVNPVTPPGPTSMSIQFGTPSGGPTPTTAAVKK